VRGIELTPAQVDAIHIRLTATCTNVQIRRWADTGQMIEVSQFQRQRLIETVKVGPSGTVKVLA
jgi:hypothetical protein